jgi:phage-related protein (TIGR01555 family)
MPTKTTKPKPIAFRDAMRMGKRISEGFRKDGWENVLTGLGGVRDKSTAASFKSSGWLSDGEISALLNSNDLARTIVLTLVQDALREGFGPSYSEEGPENEKKIDAVKRELRRLQVGPKFAEAAVLGRAFGGSRIIVGARGAGRPEKPMSGDLVKGIEFLTVLDRRSLSPRTYYEDPLAEKFGETETFYVHPITRSTSQRTMVHESRTIAFGGAWTEPQTKEHRAGWDLSVLDPVYDVLRSTGQNWQSITNMLTDASQAIFKIKGLIDAISEGNKDEFQTRMELVDMSRSVARAVVLDAEEEDFSFAERGALSGLDGVIDKFFLRLASAARMPVTILLGQAPAGLNATGAIDLRWWYDSVAAYRRDELTPALERVIRMIVRGLFPQDNLEAWGVEWPSLWQMSPAEEADYRNKLADADTKWVSMGALDPLEVALSRFRDGKVTGGYTAVDLEHKRAMLEIAQEDPEEPNAPPPAPGQGPAEDPEEEPPA